ncbi:hypothetical protein AURDEDRAFT_157893 [Auricularia subglabra TFB-10046 SS5]|nr:hypothetical protein AURDEDRAFT_157893 [Auricularia subglabra TFB-10046 SS5]
MTLAPLIDCDKTTADFVGSHAFEAAGKNVSQSLHTCAPLLVALHFARSGTVRVATLTRGLLTSLQHSQHIDNDCAHDQFKLAAALLVAGDMISWSSLCGTVAALDWTGWSAVGLPAFTKRVPSLFAADAGTHTTRLATRVLTELCSNALTPAADDTAFWDAVRAHVDHRLDRWTWSEENVVELSAMLMLMPVLSRVEAKLNVIIERPLDGDITREAGWVLNRCFEALSPTKHVGVEKWTPRVVERWMVDEHAVSGFVALVQAIPSVSVTLPPKHALPALPSLNRALRLAALPLSEPAATAAVRHMLAAEERPLDVAGSHGRTVRITKLPALLGTTDNAKVGIAWLLGQLKHNLRPVWDPATKALVELADRCGDDVWEAVWEELNRDEETGKAEATWR